MIMGAVQLYWYITINVTFMLLVRKYHYLFILINVAISELKSVLYRFLSYYLNRL